MKWTLGLLCLTVAGIGLAADPSLSLAARTAADNTGANAGNQSLTAEDQSEAPRDRELTRRIRSSLVKNKRLSTNAKNVKVIARGGKVTLRGPVNSEQEKQSVFITAEGVAGKANVTNQLEVNQKSK